MNIECDFLLTWPAPIWVLWEANLRQRPSRGKLRRNALGREQGPAEGEAGADGVCRKAALVTLRAVLKMDDPSELS